MNVLLPVNVQHLHQGYGGREGQHVPYPQHSVGRLVLMIILQGRKSYHGTMVDNEYWTAVAVCFVASILSNIAKAGKNKLSNHGLFHPTGKVFGFIMFMQLFNTFNVGVMTGEQYFKAEADQITASCKADGGYFSSFIFLFSMDAIMP